MINLKEYEQLRTAADKAKSDADRAEGSYQQALKQLETEFKCSTPEEAKTKLAKLEKELTEAETAFNEKLEDFDKKWKQCIGAT